jgi:predicted dehydrogenase
LNAPRVALVGARRRRQGLGPFVARDLVKAGARVPCFLGTSEETVAAARLDLERRCGVAARGYVDLDRMLTSERLEALAILSPAETHEMHLGSALEARLHVLCEKPLLWGGSGLAGRAAAWSDRFRDARLLLRENCQWPYTLPAFRELHPSALDEPVRSFAMRLSPVSSGIQMLGDSLPHALSLLQALATDDDARVEEPRFSTESSSSGSVTAAFTYRAGDAAIEAEIELTRSDAFPRAAAYGVNGHWVDRRVRPDDYSMRFASEGREVELDDPLGLRIAAFVRELGSVCQGGKPAQALEIVQRMEMLESLARAFERSVGH